jgi:hypothetical protein
VATNRGLLPHRTVCGQGWVRGEGTGLYSTLPATLIAICDLARQDVLTCASLRSTLKRCLSEPAPLRLASGRQFSGICSCCKLPTHCSSTCACSPCRHWRLIGCAGFAGYALARYFGCGWWHKLAPVQRYVQQPIQLGYSLLCIPTNCMKRWQSKLLSPGTIALHHGSFVTQHAKECWEARAQSADAWGGLHGGESHFKAPVQQEG